MRKIKPIEIEIREDTHKCLSCKRTFYKFEDACPHCGSVGDAIPLGPPVFSVEDIDRITELNRRFFASRNPAQGDLKSEARTDAPSEMEMIAYVKNLNQRFKL